MPREGKGNRCGAELMNVCCATRGVRKKHTTGNGTESAAVLFIVAVEKVEENFRLAESDEQPEKSVKLSTLRARRFIDISPANSRCWRFVVLCAINACFIPQVVPPQSPSQAWRPSLHARQHATHSQRAVSSIFFGVAFARRSPRESQAAPSPSPPRVRVFVDDGESFFR